MYFNSVLRAIHLLPFASKETCLPPGQQRDTENRRTGRWAGRRPWIEMHNKWDWKRNCTKCLLRLSFRNHFWFGQSFHHNYLTQIGSHLHTTALNALMKHSCFVSLSNRWSCDRLLTLVTTHRTTMTATHTHTWWLHDSWCIRFPNKTSLAHQSIRYVKWN